MNQKIALKHQTLYQFDRPVQLGPHLIRLYPASHCSMPVEHHSLTIHSSQYSLYRFQEPYGNFVAKVIFLAPQDKVEVEVNLSTEITSINPFDFLIDPEAINYPFHYETYLKKELAPFLEITESGPFLEKWVTTFQNQKDSTVNFLVNINQHLHTEIEYSQRWEHGVQSCEETLSNKVGSCRDTSWLFIQILRHCGFAARFVSGYLIQLVPAQKTPDAPKEDSAALHAWVEVYLPGAGWIGLDPTSGLFAAEGHIPLACAADPKHAAPITGSSEPCESKFHFSMSLSRIS